MSRRDPREPRADRHDPGAGEPAKTLRLFFAATPGDDVRAALLAAAAEVARGTGGRAPRVENLHLTIAFLGHLPHERLAELRAVGAAAAARAVPFELALTRVGVFRDAGIAWLGAERTPETLGKLVDSLRAGLRARALPAESRPFHAHVTLARRCARPWSGGAFAPIAWHVDALALIASETTPEGPRYRALDVWPLAAAPTMA